MNSGPVKSRPGWITISGRPVADAVPIAAGTPGWMPSLSRIVASRDCILYTQELA
jgi:hypothetical protein